MLALLLALLTFALFRPAARYGYVKLDDDQYVASNLRVTTGLTADNVRWAFHTVYEDWWLPLLWMSFMADSEVYGPVPAGYHTTNILLHALNAGLLCWILFRLTGSRWRSFFCAALFAVHPLRVESVAWITARKDVLSGLFFLLGLLAYVRYVERPGAARFAVLAALMLMGLLSKAIVLVLPFVLLLLDYWPLRRAGDPRDPAGLKTWRGLLAEKIPLFLLAGVFILINLGTHVAGRGADSNLSAATRLGLIPPNYWAYLAKICWPVRLVLFYPEHDVVRWPVTLAALAGLLGVTLLLLRCRKAAPHLAVGWLWFLVALFPVIRGVRLGLAAYADRFAYLPSIGLGLALVWGVAALAERRRSLAAAAALAGLLLLGAGAWKTRAQLPLWADSFTMFGRLVRLEPDCDLANNSFGKALMERGPLAEALPYFKKAAALNPAGSRGVVNYADALIRLGRDDEAIAWLQDARAKGYPEVTELDVLLGFAYLNTGRAEEAVPRLQRVSRNRPEQFGWRIELVRALYEAGRPDEAAAEIRRLQAAGLSSIRDFDSLAPHYADVWRAGEKLHAWRFFQNALKRRPGDVATLNLAAWLLATDDAPPAPPEEAVGLAQRAVELSGGPDPVLLDTLAAALAAAGRYDEAERAAGEALGLAQARGMSGLVLRIGPRRALYAEGKAWREPPADGL
ncbi:MAG TPA: tetratricopeptide repeat protein [Kiritimatiellia bacterium]|nr:tetratricopeptide repeat protein [Kiritimatiellia bacterium]HRZ11676.1 tetratricopeptide repeat protein [Kiritimatiellia bacterium]HSA16773.1 tetratricopeptide repeat protein [Kiritimatiellia bacterium]